MRFLLAQYFFGRLNIKKIPNKGYDQIEITQIFRFFKKKVIVPIIRL